MLFTKPAVAGRVKTRLIAREGRSGGLSPGQAAELHQAFLEDLCERLAGGSFRLTVAWAMEEGEVPPASEYSALRQSGDNLGERLYSALTEAALSHELVAAVGSDHPELPLEAVELGFGRLREGADVVLGPAEDGGYYFVGVRSTGLRRRMFEDIEWSTSSVLEATRERCRELGLHVELLEEAPDVDTPADLERLAKRLEGAGRHDVDPGDRCPRTERLLRDWGLIPVPDRVTI